MRPCVFVLDAMLWLTPRGEIAIPMQPISHDGQALSIVGTALSIAVIRGDAATRRLLETNGTRVQPPVISL